jgi:cobalt-zinc-cadmium efflux system membrane fusion protein
MSALLYPRRQGLAALLAVIVPLTGCPASDHGHSHGHEEEEPRTDATTVHSGRHQLFIEHRLLVAGTGTKFVTHVTDDVTGEPRREGSITYVLRLGDGAPTEVTAENPDRAGIYEVMLTFPSTGTWRVSVKIPWADGTNEVPLPDRTVFATAEDAARSPEGEEVSGISFLKEQGWKVPVIVERAKRRPLVERVRLPGAVEALPSRQAFVTPPVAGTLQPPLDGAIPKPGDHVDAGQVVALLVPPLAGPDLLAFLSGRQQLEALRVQLATQEAEARARAERGTAVLEQARRAHARVRDLAAENARSARELEEAESAERVAAAEQAAATRLAELLAETRANLAGAGGDADLSKGLPAVLLRAPITGFVSSVNASRGEHVTPERALLRIVDTSVVVVEARLPEASVRRLGKGRSAFAEALDAQGELAPLTGEGVGRFLYVGHEVDESTRTVPLVWEVQNLKGTLRPGQTLDIHVETSRTESAVVVPSSALVAEDARWVVFVEAAGETYQRRDVTLGIRSGDWVEVRSGVAEGEWVVTHGGLAIRLASVSSVIPAHGHAH